MTHREIFFGVFGLGPHECFFCREPIHEEVLVHHHNEDPSCNHPYNLVPAHSACHTRWHRRFVVMPPMSEEHKAKLKAANTGRKHSPETIEKMRAARLKQRPISQETRERMRIARRNRDPEANARAGMKLRGRKLNPEHRAAISKGLKKAWEEGRRTWRS